MKSAIVLTVFIVLNIFFISELFSQSPNKMGYGAVLISTTDSNSNPFTPKTNCTETSCADPIIFPSLVSGTAVCLSECNNGASSGPNFVGNNCYDHPNPTVWFQVTTLANTASLNITVNSSDINNPYFSVFGTTNCTNYTIYNNNGDCFNGTGGSTSGNVSVPINTTLLIAVSGGTGQVGDFDICVTALPDQSACNVSNAITVTNTSMGSPLNGPYLPGETVSICYDIFQYTQANCNWLHGIVPDFGDCWDPANFNAAGMPINITQPLVRAGNAYTNGIWQWFADGVVQYNTAPFQNVGAGWFFTQTPSTNPNDSWGDGNMAGCQGNMSGLQWSVCFDLTVRTDCEQGTNCFLSFKTYADGETGSWQSIGCAADIPTILNASSICCELIVDAGVDVAICSNGSTQLNGSYSGEDGATTFAWSASPAGALAGLSDPNILDPVFIPPPGISGPVTFTLTVTDTKCTRTDDVVVTVNLLPDITPQPNVFVCDSYTLPGITGSNLTGNQAYYTGPGGTGTQYVAGTNLSSGSFASYPVTIYIYDQTGTNPNCFDESSFELSIGATPNVSLLSFGNVCINNGVLLGLSGGSPSGGVYSGNGVSDNGDGATFDFDPVAAGLGTHTISYTVTTLPAPPACQSFASIQITVFDAPTISGNLAVCVGGTTQLTGSGTPAAANPWLSSDPSIATVNINGDVTGISPGIVTITYTDANGCNSEVSFTVNPNPVITLNPIDPSVCDGDDGSITVSGAGTGTVSWTGLAAGSNSPVSLPYSISGLVSGNYNVTFIDGTTGCVSAVVSTLLNNPGAPVINPIPDFTSCEVDFVVPDPLTEITGTSLTGNQAFYSAPGGNPANELPEGFVINAAMSPMTIYAYDNNGSCDVEFAFIVDVNENPIASISPDPAIVCEGVAIQLNGNPSAGSGTYSSNTWTGDVSILNATNVINPTVISTTTPGTYNLIYTVVDNSGCIGTDNIQVVINEVPLLSGILQVCVNLTTIISSTGTPDAVNPWTSSNPSVALVDNFGVVTGIAAGTSEITFLDANGCSSSVEVTVNPNPIITLTPSDPSACNGNDGSIMVSGVGNGTVEWFGDATGLAGPVNLPYTISNLEAGTYDVIFTNGTTGCISNNPSTVLNNPGAPIIDPITDTISCEIEYAIPNALTYVTGLNLTGGQAFYSAPGGNVANLLATGTTITSAMSPMTIYVYDANGVCVSEVSFVVTVNPNPTVGIAPNPAAVCAGEDLQLNGNPIGGSGTYVTHSWTNTGSGSLDNTEVQSPLFNNVVAGPYDLTYTVTDDNGCVASQNTTVIVVASPLIDPIGPIEACASYDLPAITGVDLTGNQAYFDDTQANGGTIVTGPITASTTLYMYDGASGCSDEVMVVINIFDLPMVTSITGDGEYCENDLPADVLVEVTGSANWTLEFTLNGVTETISSASSPINLGSAPGIYQLVSIEDNNCANSASGSATIIIFPTPLAPSVSDDASYCSSVVFEAMTASGNGGTITWYNDDALTSIYQTGVSASPTNIIGATTYYVTETLNGCEGPFTEITITIQNCEIVVATAITPDGDGNNDRWIIPNLDEAYPNAIVRIYNRWGSLIFEHNSFSAGNYNDNAWDGTYQGKALPVGSYFYVIELNDANQEKINGAVSIILN
jgi:gliding motility-associated-like protein